VVFKNINYKKVVYKKFAIKYIVIILLRKISYIPQESTDISYIPLVLPTLYLIYHKWYFKYLIIIWFISFKYYYFNQH
jgi:predicted histidine transporter YuiF (NhaC family)